MQIHLIVLKTKRAIINSINKKDNKQSEYPVTVALNHEKIIKAPQKYQKLKFL